MADPLIRFNDNDPIEQGVDAAALNMDDVFAIQHMTGDQDDKMLKLKQVVAVPQLVAGAFNSNRVCTATCLNYPSFQPVLGQPLDIVFNSAYTANGIPSVSYGGLTLPIRAQGVPVGNGFNIFPSGNIRSFHATVKTTATTASAAQTKSKWYIDLDSNIVSVDSSAGVITYADGSTVYNKQSVDNTLTDYNKNVMIGISSTEAYYKIENFLNRTLLLTDSLGNVWLLTGNSGGIAITKIAQRNTTTEIFHYDAEKKILYIKVLQGYGFYISIVANVAGPLRVSRSTDGTEFEATTNVITEVNLITR